MRFHIHPARRTALLLVVLALVPLALSACGGGGDTSSSTDETGSIETQLQEAVAGAGATCTELAEGISGKTARGAAESGCESVQGSLEKEVESAASAARGSANAAFEALVEKCGDLAAELSFGEGAALKLCEEIEQLKTGS